MRIVSRAKIGGIFKLPSIFLCKK